MESSFLPVSFRVGVCKGMSKSRREDLKYWADKLAYAETLSYSVGMKTIIAELKERLELVDKGQLPYCETDADKVAMYASQEAELDAMVAAANKTKRDLASERESYEACIAAARRAA